MSPLPGNGGAQGWRVTDDLCYANDQSNTPVDDDKK